MLKRTIFEEEHNIFRQTVRAWAEREVYPHRETWREAGCVTEDVWRSAGSEGFLCMYADQKYGGLGLDDFRYDMILCEELGPREPGFFIWAHNRIMGPYGKQAWWGMLATHPARRGHRLSLILGAHVLLEMENRFGFRAFMTGVEPGNAPSESICARIGLSRGAFAIIACTDPQALASGRMTK